MKQFLLILSFLVCSSSLLAQLQLKKPAAGDIWPALSVQRIEWSSANIDNIKLETSLDSGRTWTVLLSSYPASATYYEWTVPEKTSDSCYIRISDVLDASTSSSNYKNNPFKIPAPSISIDPLPNAVFAGTILPISWVSSGIRKINIYVSYDNKATYTKIADTIPGNYFYYNWIVPANYQTNCFIKLVSASNTGLTAINESAFAIETLAKGQLDKFKGGAFDGHSVSSNAKRLLEITKPNARDSVFGNTAYSISWKQNNLERINLYYTLDNGTNWISIATSLAAGSGSYNWTMPTTATNQGLFKVEDALDTSLNDKSDYPFVIKQKQLKITDPDLTSALFKNTTFNISWNSGGVSLVKARIISNKPTQSLFDSIPANNESINKIIIASLPDSFRIVLYDVSDTSLTDTSVLLIPKRLAAGSVDKYHGGGFDGHTMAANTKSTIKLLSPVGGEKISVLYNQTVRWRTENIERVSLDYSLDSGKTWTNAGENLTATTNTYTWKTPNKPSTKCLVRVRNSMDSLLKAMSDSVFTLFPKQLFNITDSLNWTIGMAKSIEWQGMGVDTIKIVYKTSAQQNWITLKDSVPAILENYNWILPTSLTDSLWIRMSDLSDSTVKAEGSYFKKFTKLIQNFSPIKYRGGSFDGHTQRSNVNKVIVSRPAENEILIGGETYTIKWTTVNFEDSILLQYSIDSGLTWVNITRTTANKGMYDWKIPFTVGGVMNNGIIKMGNSVGIVKTPYTAGDGSINSTKCLIRALDITTDNQPLGISFKPFTITSNSVLVKYDISFPKISDTAYSNGLLLKLIATNSQGKKPKFFLIKGNAQLKTDSLILSGPGTIRLGAYVLGDSIRTASDTLYQQFCSNPIKPALTTKTATNFCVGDSVKIASSYKGVNQWYLNSTSILGSADSLYSAKANGLYQAAYLFDGCSSVISSPISVTVNALPTIPVISNSRPLSFSLGDSTILSSTYSAGLQWNVDGMAINGAINQSLTVKTSGSYTLKVTNASGCSANSTVVLVSQNNNQGAPIISNNRPLSFCQGDSTLLHSSFASGNQWYLNGTIINGAEQQDYIVRISGLYTVKNNAQTSAVISVTVNAVPSTPSISNNRPLSFLNGDSTTLSSSSNELNQWLLNGNAISAGTGRTLVVYTAGSYTVKVVNGFGCSAVSAPMVVQVDQTTLVPIISNKTSIVYCEGDSVVLSSNIATGNQWYLNAVIIVGATGINYTARQSGNYTVTNNAQKSSPVIVKVNPLPAIPIITNSGALSFCVGDSIQLLSSNNSGNQWYLNGFPLVGAVQNKLQLFTSGIFSVKTTSSEGCVASSASVVTSVNALLAVPVISNSRPLFFNNGDSTILISTNAVTYQWLLNGVLINGATDKELIVYAAGNYQVRINNASGCSSVSTLVAVQVSAVPNPIPKPVISNNSALVFCVGDSTVLTSSILTGNQWYKNGIVIIGANQQSLLVKASGSYTVATNTAGLSLGVTVMVNSIPEQPKIIRDINNNLVSTATNGNQWYSDNQTILIGITQQFYKPLVVGYYSVNVTQNGCTSLMSDKYYYLVTAINNISADNSIKLYPNPVKNQFVVSYHMIGVAKVSIEVTDEFGRKVLTIKNVKSGDQIDISRLTNGVYFVKTNSENGKLNSIIRILKL